MSPFVLLNSKRRSRCRCFHWLRLESIPFHDPNHDSASCLTATADAAVLSMSSSYKYGLETFNLMVNSCRLFEWYLFLWFLVKEESFRLRAPASYRTLILFYYLAFVFHIKFRNQQNEEFNIDWAFYSSPPPRGGKKRMNWMNEISWTWIILCNWLCWETIQTPRIVCG